MSTCRHSNTEGSGTLMGMVWLTPDTRTLKSFVLNLSLFLALSAKVWLPGTSSPLQGAQPMSRPSMMTMALGMFVVTVTRVTDGCWGTVGVVRVVVGGVVGVVDGGVVGCVVGGVVGRVAGGVVGRVAGGVVGRVAGGVVGCVGR